jgi:hypothetical protein
MDVVYRLPGLRARIENYPVAGVSDAFRHCHLPGVGDQLREQVITDRAQLSQVRMVGARDHQHMDRRLRIYVAKGNCAGILRHYGRRYLASRDTAEQAIRHGGILTSGIPARSGTYMVAMLRTRRAAPLVQGIATCWPCRTEELVLRPCSRKAGGVWGDWKRLGSVVWRRSVATFANDRE